MESIRISIQVIPDNQDEEIMEKVLWVKLPLEKYSPISKERAIRNSIDLMYEKLKNSLFTDLSEKTDDVLKKDDGLTAELYKGITISEYLDLKAKMLRGMENG